MLQDTFRHVAQKPDKSAYQLGLAGSPDEIGAAITELAADSANNVLPLLELAMGAAVALQAGRPQNLQHLLAHAALPDDRAADVLAHISTGMTEAQLAVALATTERLKKRFLKPAVDECPQRKTL